MIWDDPVFLAAETDAEDLLTLTAEMIVSETQVEGPQAGDAGPVALVPPTLAHATAAAGKPWRGLTIAFGLHLIILALALGLVRWHRPQPVPEGIPISVMVVPAGAQSGLGSGAALPHEAAKPVVVQPPTAPVKLLPQPPVKQPDLSTAKPMPLPPKPVTVKPAAPAEAAAPPASMAAAKSTLPNAGVTRPARAISTLNVYYSLFSREAGQQGQVGLEVWVLADGQTGNVIVVRSSGYAALDNVARNAVLGLRFRPALKNGVAVTSVLPYVFRFELQ
jgi:protein TonB